MMRLGSLGRAALVTAALLGAALPAGGQTQMPAAPPPGSPAPVTTPPAPAPDPAPQDTPAAPEGEAEQSSLELVRRSEQDGKERRIRIVRTGTSDETGIFVVCQPQDADPPETPNLAVFSESTAGGIQITIDKNLIRVPLAVVTQRPPREGQEGSDGRVEASAGSARFLEDVPENATDRLTRCGVETSPKPAPDTVLVTQGRTQLKGQKLVYDESDGVARIDGPITFQRENGEDSLRGSSQQIEVNVDAETTTLVGNVVLNSQGGRVSKAARVEYDDTRNLARLFGTPEQPAESVKGGDTLRAGMILYDLERNEVYAVKSEGGTITGEFVEAEQPAAPAPTLPAPPNP